LLLTHENSSINTPRDPPPKTLTNPS
jgi:hypothetical protein